MSFPTNLPPRAAFRLPLLQLSRTPGVARYPRRQALSASGYVTVRRAVCGTTMLAAKAAPPVASALSRTQIPPAASRRKSQHIPALPLRARTLDG